MRSMTRSSRSELAKPRPRPSSRSELANPRPMANSPCPSVSTNRRIEPHLRQDVLRGPGTFELEFAPSPLVAGAHERIDVSYIVNRASSGRGLVGTYQPTVNGKPVGIPVVAPDTGSTLSTVQGVASFMVAPGDSIGLQVTVQPGAHEGVGGGTVAVTATRESGDCGKPAFQD